MAMFRLLVCLFACAASGFGKPLGDGLPYVYTYPSYYASYQPFYQQPVVEPLRFYHSQATAYTAAGIPNPVLSYQPHQQQPIQAVPYPLISAYSGYHGQPAYGYPNPGYIFAYDTAAAAGPAESSHDMAAADDSVQKKDGPKEPMMAGDNIVARSGATGVEAHSGDMAMGNKEEMMMAIDTMPMKMPEKQARIFGSSFPFGTNLQSSKQPVLVNGNQGQKVSVLGNQYLLKLASTTKNRDGSLAGSIYPEIGGGTLFNTPASNFNG